MTIPTAADHLRERIDPKWPAVARSISINLLAAFDGFNDRKGRLNKNAADYLEKARDAARPAGKSVAAAMLALENGRAKLAADRAALRAKAFATPSTAGAEIRSFLRELPAGAVPALLLGPSADREAQRAALEAASLLTPGLSDELRQRVEAEFFAAIYPDETEAFQGTEAALDHAETSIRLAAGTIERDAGFLHRAALEKWLATDCKPDKAPSDDGDAADAERRAAIDARLAELAAA